MKGKNSDVSKPDARSDRREIRVFISSTFRDMREERDELVKRVFPQLRKLCEDRHVTWGEVDLRWGVTDEQKAEGKVLPICLEEIKRCRPYFIGLLGERYGWIPPETDIPEDLIRQQPWLAEHREHSVTELEILHGVLRNPDMARHAFFYFRDPAYAGAQPVEKQNDYLEIPSSEEIERFGRKEAEQRARERQAKLSVLKDRIRAVGFPVHENYTDPEELGRLVLEDFRRLIDDLYPEEEVPDPLDREAREHEQFARNRVRVYVGRAAYLEQLDGHASDDGPPLVVVGRSGSGKSALLSQWVMHRRGRKPNEALVFHAIGASPRSADWQHMLRRVIAELQGQLGFEMDVPSDPVELPAAFAQCLHMAAARSPTIVVLDGVNRLTDAPNTDTVSWLPPTIPAKIRLVLSTLPEAMPHPAAAEQWPPLKMEPLTDAERRELIRRLLSEYTKELSDDRVERLVKAPECGNPLYLSVLLDELRQFGVHEQLDERIDHYLRATTPAELYGLVLERWEADYERDRPGLVGDALRALWAARRGLTESELLTYLGPDDAPLPGRHWTPLRLAIGNGLMDRAGLLTFGHDYLRQAVRNRYLTGEKAARRTHRTLADHFAAAASMARRVEELPWQLARSGEWQRLGELLRDLDFLAGAWQIDSEDVLARCAEMEANSEWQLQTAFADLTATPAGPRPALWAVSCLLFNAGHFREAGAIQDHLLTRTKRDDQPPSRQEILIQQAQAVRNLGNNGRAVALLREAAEICRETGDRAELQQILGLLSFFGSDQEEAVQLLEEQERICRDLGDHDALQVCIGHQAHRLMNSGQMDRALELLAEKERLCRQLGNLSELQAALGQQGMLAREANDLELALPKHREEEHICRVLGKRMDLVIGLTNQGLVLHAQGNLQEALAIHRKAAQICREGGYLHPLQACLQNEAFALSALGDTSGAWKTLKKQEEVLRKLGDTARLEQCRSQQRRIEMRHTQDNVLREARETRQRRPHQPASPTTSPDRLPALFKAAFEVSAGTMFFALAVVGGAVGWGLAAVFLVVEARQLIKLLLVRRGFTKGGSPLPPWMYLLPSPPADRPDKGGQFLLGLVGLLMLMWMAFGAGYRFGAGHHIAPLDFSLWKVVGILLAATILAGVFSWVVGRAESIDATPKVVDPWLTLGLVVMAIVLATPLTRVPTTLYDRGYVHGWVLLEHGAVSSQTDDRTLVLKFFEPGARASFRNGLGLKHYRLDFDSIQLTAEDAATLASIELGLNFHEGAEDPATTYLPLADYLAPDTAAVTVPLADFDIQRDYGGTLHLRLTAESAPVQLRLHSLRFVRQDREQTPPDLRQSPQD